MIYFYKYATSNWIPNKDERDVKDVKDVKEKKLRRTIPVPQLESGTGAPIFNVEQEDILR